uniref:Reverse transcriptase domain-containing protein n=1 Tax=Tanacetum cinerariifolium TaxID=118510 RepID=A0A6L2LKE7_TANCI|nr:reverse transcriptase domain-containing protein [Tanacetum cinerariifolium]
MNGTDNAQIDQIRENKKRRDEHAEIISSTKNPVSGSSAEASQRRRNISSCNEDMAVAPTPKAAIVAVDLGDNFTVKGHHLSMIKDRQFDGCSQADPHKHITEFIEVCGMFRYGDTNVDAIKLKLFPSSLAGEAKIWFNELSPGVISTWEEMRQASKREIDATNVEHPLPSSDCDDKPMGGPKEEEASYASGGYQGGYRGNYYGRNPRNWRDRLYYHRDENQNSNPGEENPPIPRLPEKRPDELEFEKTMREFVIAQKTANNFVKNQFYNLKTKVEQGQKNHQAAIQDLETKFSRISDHQSSRPPASLKSKANTYRPRPARNEHANVVFTHNGMPNYDKFLKDLVSNKSKMEQISGAFLTEEYSTILQNKIPSNLGDPRSFLIPCKLTNSVGYLALADLGASINMMSYSLYTVLFGTTLKPVRMSIRLANHTYQYHMGVVENMLVQVRKFVFPVDFVILQMEEDDRVPLLGFILSCKKAMNLLKMKIVGLGGSYQSFNMRRLTIGQIFRSLKSFDGESLRDADYILRKEHNDIFILGKLIQKLLLNQKCMGYLVHAYTIFLLQGIGEDRATFHIGKAMQHSHVNDDTCFRMDVIDEITDDKLDDLLDDSKPFLNTSEKISETPLDKEFDEFIYPLGKSDALRVKKGGMSVVTNEDNELVPTRTVTGWRVCIDYPDQEKTTFTCPYGTYAYKRMPFGICNAPTTFQRCMIVIFQDTLETFMEVFMEDFLVFGDSFDSCLNKIEQMLIQCKQAHLVLNWEKSYLMVTEGMVLGHKVSRKGLEVDKAKIDVIAKLPPSINVKAVRSFLGHAKFYRRFIKDFSRISEPMTKLLQKDSVFNFDEEYNKAFKTLKEKLTNAPIMVSPNWSLPFELMCDASDFAVGVMLGQREEKHFRPIHFASKTLNSAQQNYTGAENIASDHLSRLEKPNLKELKDKEINDDFLDEFLISIKERKRARGLPTLPTT